MSKNETNGGDKMKKNTKTSFLQEAHIARRVSDTFAQSLTITRNNIYYFLIVSKFLTSSYCSI